MLKPTFKDGIPTCPCGSQEFNIGFKEIMYHQLDASKGSEGWGISEPVELARDPIEGIVCLGCDEDIEVTPEMEQFIRQVDII